MSDWNDETIDWYAEKYGDDPSVLAVVTAAGIAKGADVLDVGCGTGSALRALLGHAGRLTGVDPFERMIGHARAQSAGLEIAFHVAGAEALPVAAGSQDVVLAINSVHHWTDLDAGLREVARVLRVGGRVVIGGEDFGEGMVPGGQDYRAVLAAHGFVGAESAVIDGGFVISASKGETR